MAQSFRTSRVALFAVAALAGLTAAGAAHAGFEWRGPLTPPAPPPRAVPSPAAPMNDMTGLEPVISWDGAPPPEQMPAVQAVPVESGPVDIVPVEVAPAAVLPSAEKSADALEGFGHDLPLVIALQQVAPAGFRVSFAGGVDPGVHVSWTGGKPWRLVLDDMLAGVGLISHVSDNTVIVMRASAAPAVPAAVEAVPAPPLPAPEESGRVLIGHASETGASLDATKLSPAPAAGAEGVDIRRERPKSSFLDRLRSWAGEKKEADVWAETGEVSVSSTPAPLPSKLATERPVAENHVAEKPAVVTEAPLDLPPPAAVKTEVQAPIPLKKTQVVEDVPPPAEALAAPALTAAPVAVVPAAAVPAAPTAAPADIVIAAPADIVIAAPADTVAAAPADIAPVAPVVPATLPAWTGAKGQTLREVLKSWSAKAGVELYWVVDYDYKLDADLAYAGTYDEAVDQALKAFASAKPQPYGSLHQSSDGPRVLVIKVYGQ